MSPPAIELCLFGAPHLRRGEERLHVGARKAMTLLALLAVEGASPRAAIAARLWPDAAADAALRNLRQELFRLRRLGVEPDARSERSLALPAALAVDLQRFEAALAAGDDSLALAISAGKAFDGLDGVAGDEIDAWFDRQRTKLQQQRQRARSRLAERLEAAGDRAAALALHQQALADDGCAESVACAAMRLLVALGDRAAAAALLARLTRTLRFELDLAPAPETLAAAAALGLAAAPDDAGADEPTVGARPAALPAALLPERLPFVGRAALVTRITGAIAAGQRVYLSGVAGSGKTRLAAACAGACGAWLSVGCETADAGVAYSSALRVLRALREAAPDVELAPWVRRELGWLMPELGAGPLPQPGAEAGERLRAAFAAAWQRLAGDNFSAIVLDDWHWADDASVGLWRRVEARGSASIVAFRSAQLGAAALATMRDEVDRGAAVLVETDAFDEDEALALVRAASGSPRGTLFARRLQQATGGNPFFLVETLRHLAQQGQLQVGPDGRWSTPYDEATADYSELPVPPSVREVVLGRVRALGDAARRLLEAASLLGDPFDARLLQGSTEAGADAVVALLEHAQAARLLATDGAQYRFAHDLVAQCLAQSLSPARRRLLHARLARRLATAGVAPSLVAAHCEGAGEAATAVRWRLQAAAAAWSAHAAAETRLHCRQALSDGAAGRDAADATMRLADVERHAGDAAAFGRAMQAAVDAARAVDTETWLAARLTQLRHWITADRVADALPALDALAADLASAPPALRARACAVRAVALQMSGRLDEARQLEDEAIALLEGVPQAQAQRAELLDAAARTAARGNDFARAEAMARRAVAAAESVGDAAAHSRSLVVLGVAALYGRNDRVTAEAAFDRSRALAQGCGHVPQQRAAILNLVKLHTDAGRGDAANALLDEGEALAPGFEHPRAKQAFLEARYFVHYLRGDIAAARAAAAALIDAVRPIDDIEIRLAACQLVLDLHLHTGDVDAAERLLDEAGDSRVSSVHAVLTAKRAWFDLARGDAAAALARLDALGAAQRVEDGLVAAWVGAAAAIAIGDTDGAAARLAVVDIDQEHTVDALAMVLVQRLRLAARLGRDDPAARARAADLLPRVPALEADRLREALAERRPG